MGKKQLADKRVYQVTVDGKRIQIRIEEYLIEKATDIERRVGVKAPEQRVTHNVRVAIKLALRAGAANLTAYVKRKLIEFYFGKCG